MKIVNVDTDLNIKMKEGFKAILKKAGTKIFFEFPNTELEEVIKVENDFHFFTLEKTKEHNDFIDINHKYDKLITIFIKKKNPEKRLKILNILSKILFFLKPFKGPLYKKNTIHIYSFKMVYNGIIIDLNKMEYDKLSYYSKYSYKVQQLNKLNSELNLNQEYSIIFDDEDEIKNIYVDIYNNFKDIIEPIDEEIKFLLRKKNNGEN